MPSARTRTPDTRKKSVLQVTAWAATASLVLAACLPVREPPLSSIPVTPTLAAVSSPRPAIVPSETVTAEPTSFRVGAVIPATIYSGPGKDYGQAGILEAGASVGVMETTEGSYGSDRWLRIVCPENIRGECWVLWDMNALYPYEGPPSSLQIPDPASLKIEITDTFRSPNGLWEALVTQSEITILGVEGARFFYVELEVTSLENRQTWKPVSEWHAAGPGAEGPPRPFHWSQDGRYLYYTSLFDYHGGCVYANLGETLDRLDLSDGSVAVLPPPHALRNLSISPDEASMAHTSDSTLVVRDLATAYEEGPSGPDSIRWQLDLDLDWPRTQVSEMVWSPDSRELTITTTTLIDDLCNKESVTTWRLDIATGEFLEVLHTVIPTPTP